jgi:hypothetical protein
MPKSPFSASSRQEFIADITLTTVDTLYTLPTNGGLIPNDRFMYALWLWFEGRITNNAANNPTGVQADAPFSLIELITVSGFHRVRSVNEPFINLRGAELYNLIRIMSGQIPYVVPNSQGAPVFTVSLATGANATNDIRFGLMLPFTPMRIPLNTQTGWLLDAPNYDQLKLQVSYSDDNSVFTYGATHGASAYSAFGGATGSPRVRVEGQFALLNQSASGFIPARTWRYFQENTTGDITGSGTITGSRQYNIPRGNKVRAVLLKTGVKGTTVTAGFNAYNTLSDSIFSNIKVQRGLNKTIRFYSDYLKIQNETAHSYGVFPRSGYALIDFAQRGRLEEALDTVGMVAGPSGDTDLFVQADVAGAANQGALFLIEELRGIPRRLGATGQ